MADQTTPYAPPLSHIDAPEQALTVEPASRWLRLVNLIIDYIACLFLSAVLGIVIALVFGQAGIRFLHSMPQIVVGTPIILGYYLLFEAAMGRTPGKFVTGTKVVNSEGRSASFKQTLGRSFSRLIPFEAFSFLSSTQRGWHDRLPGTYVVRCR